MNYVPLGVWATVVISDAWDVNRTCPYMWKERSAVSMSSTSESMLLVKENLA